MTWRNPTPEEKVKINESKRLNKIERRIRARQFVDGYKSAPCVDCQKYHTPRCMEFDHLDAQQKSNNISQMVYDACNLEIIFAEILKCELVCANCHRIRTARREGKPLIFYCRLGFKVDH